MYSKIIKKKSEKMDEESKPLHVGKKAMMHAMESMKPEMKDEDEDGMEEGSLSKKNKSKFKGMMPEAKIEIELMLEGVKNKKGK
jgi:hypothetical protein